MSYTSSDVKMRYNSKAYHKLNVMLRLNEDSDIIDFIEAQKEHTGTTQLFREALGLYIKREKSEV